MVRARVVETDSGIRGDFNIEMYDRMQRYLRDRGWIETRQIVASGIDAGRALEVGPGPGYLGLEWLKLTRRTRLVGLDLRRDMLRPLRWFLWMATKPREIRPGLATSIDAAYTPRELEQIIDRCALCGQATVSKNPLGLTVKARKTF